MTINKKFYVQQDLGLPGENVDASTGIANVLKALEESDEHMFNQHLNAESAFFGVTFQLPKEFEERVLKRLKEVGKDYFSKRILEMILEEHNASLW